MSDLSLDMDERIGFSFPFHPLESTSVRRANVNRTLQQLNQNLNDDLPYHAGSSVQRPDRRDRLLDIIDNVSDIMRETPASSMNRASGGSFTSQHRINPAAERPPEYSLTDLYHGSRQPRRRAPESTASSASRRSRHTVEELETIRRKEMEEWWSRQWTLFLKFLEALNIVFFGLFLALFACAALFAVKVFHVYLDSILEGWFEGALESLPLFNGGRIAGGV